VPAAPAVRDKPFILCLNLTRAANALVDDDETSDRKKSLPGDITSPMRQVYFAACAPIAVLCLFRALVHRAFPCSAISENSSLLANCVFPYSEYFAVC
jgi:hypothetical protein